MGDFVYLVKKQEEPSTKPESGDKNYGWRLTNKERKQLQHEFRIHTECYLKKLIGKSSDYTKVIIWEQMLILQGTKFLTDPEKYIAQTPNGSELINAARLHIASQSIKDNQRYFEEKLGAKCIQHSFDVDSKNDYWMHLMIFDRTLIEQN